MEGLEAEMDPQGGDEPGREGEPAVAHRFPAEGFGRRMGWV